MSDSDQPSGLRKANCEAVDQPSGLRKANCEAVDQPSGLRKANCEAVDHVTCECYTNYKFVDRLWNLAKYHFWLPTDDLRALTSKSRKELFIHFGFDIHLVLDSDIIAFTDQMTVVYVKVGGSICGTTSQEIIFLYPKKKWRHILHNSVSDKTNTRAFRGIKVIKV